MNNVVSLLIAGMLFGAWPLLMNRSNLPGNVSALALGVILAVGVLPFAISSLGSLANVRWGYVIIAGLANVVGILILNGMLSREHPDVVAPLIVYMVVIQILTNAVYQVVVKVAAKGVWPEWWRILGFVLAIVAAILLTLPDKQADGDKSVSLTDQSNR